LTDEQEYHGEVVPYYHRPCRKRAKTANTLL
jgi:hypothetical protein